MHLEKRFFLFNLIDYFALRFWRLKLSIKFNMNQKPKITVYENS